jgi:hypothetical protein
VGTKRRVRDMAQHRTSSYGKETGLMRTGAGNCGQQLQLQTRKPEMMKARNEGALSVLHYSLDDQSGCVEVE